MSHTKDEIEIQVTKKDRIYLSIILCLILVVALVCILVPRYYYLQNKNNKPDTSQSSGSTSSDSSSEDSSITINPNTHESVNYAYLNHYSTKVINELYPLGMPYKTLANHMDSYGILNVVGIGITTIELENLEALAFQIHNTLQQYKSNGSTITTTLINSDNTLHSQIVAFSNDLNQIAES